MFGFGLDFYKLFDLVLEALKDHAIALDRLEQQVAELQLNDSFGLLVTCNAREIKKLKARIEVLERELELLK